MDVVTRIGEAVELGQRGDAEEARRRLAELWDDPAVQADPLARCTLAHHAADLQPTVIEELAWDLRALEAADGITAERAREQHPDLDVAALYPSLHLNLGDAYHRLGDAAGALKRSEFYRRAFGDRFVDWYVGLKEFEVGRFTEAEPGWQDDPDTVTAWEHREYFTRY